MLENLIIIIHLLAAVAVVVLILLQHGKGAEMGASFGAGSSQTVFGVQGSGNLLTHSTAIFTTVFFVTSLGLAYIAKQKTEINPNDVINEEIIAEHAAANDEVPAAATATAEVPAAESAAPESVAPETDVPPAEAAPAAPAATTGGDIPE